MRPEREKGAALLTVLLMVAVIAVIAVAVLDDIRFGVRRATNARAASQAQWYAIGAEQLARRHISRLTQRDPFRTTLEGDWNGRVLRFPIDHGAMAVRVSDATGCFNLNSLVEADQGEPYRRRELGVRQFTQLLSLLGVGDTATLAENLVQWMDSNDVGPSEAEDPGYAALPTPYRTAGGPLAEVSELRAVRGFTPKTYAMIRPYVCALPTTDLSPININTLPPDRALLLSALTEGATPEAVARAALAGRPATGWPDVATFWSQRALLAAPPRDEVREQLRVRTRYFAMETQVTFADLPIASSALFEAPSVGGVRLVARRWTLDE